MKIKWHKIRDVLLFWTHIDYGTDRRESSTLGIWNFAKNHIPYVWQTNYRTGKPNVYWYRKEKMK